MGSLAWFFGAATDISDLTGWLWINEKPDPRTAWATAAQLSSRE